METTITSTIILCHPEEQELLSSKERTTFYACPHIYLYGSLETQIDNLLDPLGERDIDSRIISSNVILNRLPSGVYLASYKGINCNIYLWNIVLDITGGYVVEEDSLKDNLDIRDKYGRRVY
ncbi:hypothetical protein H6G33_10355 [Calothrix sp. FACHB-1219]|uniref:hypothetical protein n=1 Tax=unclassified Calothrix TaxID=2619626 RepID=UPI0016895765|nr:MULTISPECIES: hypothetical protein [unclassified Calothrix]MBD2201748.1 hypothetical protein [Calothrix sp. FACHB-168]MBD2217434.1 hypothetical protein [Calothrix sp. FACHB-1219]